MSVTRYKAINHSTGRNNVFPFSKDVEKIDFQQISNIFERWVFKFGERCWKLICRRLSTYRKMNFSIFQRFRKMSLQVRWNMLKVHLPTTFYFSKDILLYLSKVLKFELSIFQKDVENWYIDVFQLFERRVSLSFKSFEIWTFNFSKRYRTLINRRLSTFWKTDFFIFQKFWKLNFQFFGKMSKTHISTSFNFSKDGLIHLSKVFKFELSFFSKRCRKLIYRRLQTFRKTTCCVFQYRSSSSRSENGVRWLSNFDVFFEVSPTSVFHWRKFPIFAPKAWARVRKHGGRVLI